MISIRKWEPTHESKDITPVVQSRTIGASQVCGVHTKNPSEERHGQKDDCYDCEPIPQNLLSVFPPQSVGIGS